MVAMLTIPNNVRVPFVTAEFDNSRAERGPVSLVYRALLIGQKLAGGSAAPNTLHRVTSADQVRALAGRGSQLHDMAKAWVANNKSTELWIGVLADHGSGVAATWTITITGPATAAGTIALYIGGQLVHVAVAASDTATQIATKIVAAIGATPGANDLLVTAVSTDGVVTLTANNKGAAANGIDVRINYADGEALPAGVAAVVAVGTPGATDPVLTTLLDALNDTWFNVWAHPYIGAAQLTSIEGALAERASWGKMLDAVAIGASALGLGDHSTLTQGRNSQWSCIAPTNQAPTFVGAYAAALAAQIAYYAAIDPAAPFTGIELKGILPPALADRWTFDERNTLLYAGSASTRVGPSGLVQIERMVTTYRLNAAGGDDASWLDLQVALTLMYARYNWRTRISRYYDYKLGNDGATFPAGERIMTPALGRAEALAWFFDMSGASPVVFDPSTLDQFKRDLVVERASDPNRLDFLLPPDLINRLVFVAARIQFL